MALMSSSPKWPAVAGHRDEWALVDVETSGLSAARDRVLSLAILTLDAHGRQTGEFFTLLDPGCDPGPVHIHGLTPARLAGARTFDQVAHEVDDLLRGRVFVAHNAQFDHNFLSHEFARAGAEFPAGRRLCTLALNRLIGPPTADLKLGTLAAHYGVRQQRAHDAQDDVRVLSGILRGSLGAAERLGLSLPLLGGPTRQVFRPRIPKTPCAYRNPGRLERGHPLVQGMKVSISGETRVSREELVARSVAAGLNMMTSVSAQTSALVTNDANTSSDKLRRAAAEGVLLVDEPTYLRLLEDVRPGQAKGAARPAGTARNSGGTRAVAPTSGPSLPAPRPPEATPVSPAPTAGRARPLAGRRVLVLGGTHDEAAAVRGRAVAHGASAAVNLSASVTDVVMLRGGEADKRRSRIATLGLRVHDAEWIMADEPALTSANPPSVAGTLRDGAEVLVRGAVVDLPDTGAPWTVSATWGQHTACDVDVVAFALDTHEKVPGDEDFVFHGAPEHPDGTVRLAVDSPTGQAVSVEPERLPLEIRRVVIAAAIDGAATFSEVGAIEITATCGVGSAPAARATLDAATTERTMILAEMYRRGDGWRLRAVGQGYDHGLAELARGYGVDVAG
ncbi:TerD family protein [Streptomyces sp. NBC_00102]|uniref:TerD family protein n=1 Tax=Streptomyces sp. NBC_00102 TaxID=2975652 RepID=UPI00224EAD7E|nr:TerD family protein [Streptomyces sp. NBC_00102]MCX5401724.1 TerD family protein [Streptomyces sp. NBC_00102]